MNLKRGFASDNNSGIDPRILNALERANSGHCIGYGDDPFTHSAIERFKEQFGAEIDVYLVFTGTASNVLGIRSGAESYNSVICSDSAHLNVDECGAPENFTGCKLITLPTKNGKITCQQIEPLLNVFDVPHHSQPRVVSITQATEWGTVYKPAEVKEIAGFAHKHGMILHMDGARLSNAAASLHLSLKEITKDADVDVLSFGGTKNGMMIGEAVIFFNRELSKNFKYIRKQGMQLASKMRFLSAQFEAFLSNDLWLNNARHANMMARLLAQELEKIPQCRITQEVEANGVFATIPPECIDEIQKKYFFYIWDKEGPVIRLMTSFDTKEEDVMDFIEVLKKAIHDTIACS